MRGAGRGRSAELPLAWLGAVAIGVWCSCRAGTRFCASVVHCNRVQCRPNGHEHATTRLGGRPPSNTPACRFSPFKQLNSNVCARHHPLCRPRFCCHVQAGRQATLLRKAGAAPCHPLNPAYPEGEYLTNLTLRLL